MTRRPTTPAALVILALAMLRAPAAARAQEPGPEPKPSAGDRVRITLKDGRVIEGVLRDGPRSYRVAPAGADGAEPEEIPADAIWRIERLPEDGEMTPDLAALVEKIRGADEPARRAALEEIERRGPAAAAAAPALAEAMAHEDTRIALHAARALGAIGAPAMPTLLRLVREASPAARRYLRYAFGELGADAVPALVELLDPAQPAAVQRQAVEALAALRDAAAIAEAAPALLELLGRESDASTLLQAAVALSRCGRKDEAAARLIDALGEAGRVGGAARALGQLGSDVAERAVPALIEALRAPDPRDRQEVVQALGRMGEAAAAARPILIEMLGAGDERDASTAARALVELGPEGLTAVLEASEHEDPRVRRATINVLRPRGARPDPRVIARLVAALEDPASEVRQAAANAFRSARETPAEAVGPLVKLLSDPDRNVARSAASTLARAGEEAIEPLVAMLEGEDVAARFTAAAALFEMRRAGAAGDAARERASALLAEAILDPDPAMRAAAREALGRSFGEVPDALSGAVAKALTHEDAAVRQDAFELASGHLFRRDARVIDAVLVLMEKGEGITRQQAVATLDLLALDEAAKRRAVPVLSRLLGEQDQLLRSRAADALGRLGDAAAPAVAALTKLLKSGTATDDAVRALGQLGPMAAPAAGALAELLAKDEIAHYRLQAAVALENIGPGAKAALPALKKAAEADADERVRDYARRAIRAIEGD